MIDACDQPCGQHARRGRSYRTRSPCVYLQRDDSHVSHDGRDASIPSWRSAWTTACVRSFTATAHKIVLMKFLII